jgi:hypothetical protein
MLSITISRNAADGTAHFVNRDRGLIVVQQRENGMAKISNRMINFLDRPFALLLHGFVRNHGQHPLQPETGRKQPTDHAIVKFPSDSLAIGEHSASLVMLLQAFSFCSGCRRVSHDRDDAKFLAVERAQRDLYGEIGTIFAPGAEVKPNAHMPLRWGRCIPSPEDSVRGLDGFRHQGVDRLTNELRLFVTEHSCQFWIHQEHRSVAVADNQPVWEARNDFNQFNAE